MIPHLGVVKFIPRRPWQEFSENFDDAVAGNCMLQRAISVLILIYIGPTMDSLLRDILHPHIDPSKMADSKPCHVVVRILWFLLDDRLQHSLRFVVPRINPPGLEKS